MQNKKTVKPRLVFLLLKWFLPEYDRESVYNSFEDMYEYTLSEKGRFYSGFWILIQIFRSLPGLISAKIYWKYVLLKNYLTIAKRNIVKNKLYTIINITGLSIGIICFLLTLIYIKYEYEYDRYHKNAGNIYRIVCKTGTEIGQERNDACCPSPFADVLKYEYPDVIKESVRFWNYWGLGFSVQYNDKIFREVNFTFVDSSVFKIFDFEFIKGSSEHALAGPYKTVITESAAKKYFGENDPLGKSLKVNDGYEILVTGIIKDIPEQSHFHFDFFVSYSTLKIMAWKRYLDSWSEKFCYTYLLLQNGVSSEEMSSKFPGFVKKFIQSGNQKYDNYYLQPLSDIHLKSIMDNEIEPNSNIRHLYILFSISVFILFLAVINYINLTTAYSTVRIKEISVRKIAGSKRLQLIFQFLSESTAFCIISILFALVIITLILPYLSTLAGKNLSFYPLTGFKEILSLVIFGILLGLLSGFYPAIFVSSFRPAEFSGNMSGISMKKGSGRKILIVFQLLIASMLIICTIVMNKQVNFIQSFNVNYDKNNIVILSVNQTPVAGESYGSFVNEIKQMPGILNASGMRIIAGYNHIKENFTVEGFSSSISKQLFPFLLVRHNFMETFGLKISEGRSFSRKITSDEENAVLINETMARYLFRDTYKAVGKKLNHAGWGTLNIIGVLKDFNFESLHTPVQPLIVKLIWPRRKSPLTDYLAVRLNGDNIEGSLNILQDKWKKYAPNSAFQYFFLDDKLNQSYSTESILGRLSLVYTVIAVAIACMGLFGFISFITKKKTREIALRKVLGATLPDIIKLFSREFAVLFLTANFIIWPASWFVAEKWLQNFAYRIDVSIWIFVMSTLITFLISIITLMYHTINAASANPVDTIKHL